MGGRSAHPDTPSRRYSISLYTMQSACRGRSTKGTGTGCRLVCPARHGILPDDISSSHLGQTGPAARSMSALLQVCRSVCLSTCNRATWATTRSRRLPVPATHRLLLLLPGIEADRIDDGLAPESGNQSARSRGQLTRGTENKHGERENGGRRPHADHAPGSVSGLSG